MKANNVIFVPHGPVSGHGPWTTLGVHPHGAEAVATLFDIEGEGPGQPRGCRCGAVAAEGGLLGGVPRWRW